MAALADITVFDGAATPVSHTLKATSLVTNPDGSITAKWREVAAGLPTEASIVITITQRVLKSKVVETRTRVDVPVMESVAGQNSSGYTAAPKVAYTDSDEWVSYAHPRSVPTGRRLAKQILTNLSNNISTTVAAATVGVFDDAVSSQLMPT